MEQCDSCKNYVYDEEYGGYLCLAEMDEDDVYRSFFGSRAKGCPYYHSDDDYAIVRKQN